MKKAMNPLLGLTVAVGVMLTATGTHGSDGVRAVPRADLAGSVEQQIGSDLPDLLTFYTDLHTHPELSLRETESARKIAKRLEAVGYTVTTGVGGTGVVGILENGVGPTVLVRGDMDALPITEETGLPYASTVKVTGTDGRPVGVMHACGHDIHQTCLVGTARILARLRDRWRGRVMIVAQPAEEIGAGAKMMIDDGLFERFPKPDYAIALHVSADHPAGTVAYTPGWALANVDSVDITIFGRGGHGSAPHTTIDPVITAAHVVTSLQTIVSRRLNPREPGVITVGSIHGGSKHNIISNEAKLQLTVRSYTPEARKLLLDGIRDVTTHTARAMGCTKDPEIVVRDHEFTPSTYNHPELAEAAADVFRRAIGAGNVVTREPVMGGEDFSRFSMATKNPGFIFWLGSVRRDIFEASQDPEGTPLPSLHSSKYFPDPEPSIRTGVNCMTSLTLSLLEKN